MNQDIIERKERFYNLLSQVNAPIEELPEHRESSEMEVCDEGPVLNLNHIVNDQSDGQPIIAKKSKACQTQSA
jgi:hypothetical protein